MTNLDIMKLGNNILKRYNIMACGCKNKAAKASVGVAKTSSTKSQEARPQKTSNGGRIIKREIR